jgi:hypothetical protein
MFECPDWTNLLLRAPTAPIPRLPPPTAADVQSLDLRTITTEFLVKQETKLPFKPNVRKAWTKAQRVAALEAVEPDDWNQFEDMVRLVCYTQTILLILIL